MRKTASLAPKRRVRPLLLALLWIWAACVFLVLDLFHNVPEFDGIRPRARVYRAMRHVGHRMVSLGSDLIDDECRQRTGDHE